MAIRYCLLFILMLIVGCDELAGWRDAQIRQSHQAATSGKVSAPAQPIKVPDRVARQLPLDDSFTVMSYTNAGGRVDIQALSGWDTLETTKWMLGRLAQLGYDSGDNASRILEGVEYVNKRANYSKLYVKINLNTHDQCIIQMRAGP